MADNNSQERIDVGLNLSGNALGSIEQLTMKMLSLRDAAAGVGAVLKAVNSDIAKMEKGTGGNNSALSPQMLKKLKQQMDLLTTTPDSIQRQLYNNVNKASLDNQFMQLMASRRKFSNPNTMDSLFQQFDPKVIKNVLDTRLNAARLNGDTKKAEEAKRALDQYQKTMTELSTKLKSMATLKRLQDQAAAEFLKQPMAQVATQAAASNRFNRSFLTAADERAIQQYMSNPKTLKPSTDPLSGGSTRQALAVNAQKIAAAQRLMAQTSLEPDSKARTKELATHSKILDSLEAERTKLQAISNLKRSNLKNTDDELRAIRRTADEQQRNLKLQDTLKGGLRTNTLSADRIAQLSPEDLIARQVTMTKRLSQAKTALYEAEKLGNSQAKKDATDLVVKYQQEVDAIKARTKAIRESNQEQKSDAEVSGMRLANRMSFLRDFAMLGAGIGAITGSYAFLRDFENALKQTQAISQATDTQMQSLSGSILKVAENSRFSAVEITDAATALAQAGFSMSEIETTLQSVTLLATATGSSLKETVDIATASLGAFQLSAENMPNIVNQITQAMNLSKLDIQKFQLAVQYAGNAASDAGLDFEELLSSVATVANAGVRSGSTLGTGFRQLLTDLVAPSQKFADILTRLGLSAADVDIRTKGLVGALKNLKEAGFTTADAYQSFEVRSVAFYTALSNNLQMYDDLSANLDNNTAAMDANEIQMDSLAAQTDRMTNQFKALAEVTGAGVRDTLTDVVHVIGDVLIGIRELTDNGVVRYTAQVVVMTAALTTGVVILRSSAGAIIALIDIYKKAAAAQVALSAATAGGAAAAGAATTAVTGLRAAMMVTLPQIAIITGLISAAVLAFNHFSKANDDLKNSVEATKTAVNTLNDSVSNIQTEIQETDKKILSLESRFESLKDDPVAVAVEMSKLRDRAAELGVTLGTDLKNNIESVRLGWEELRIALGKELVMNLDNQISELQNLAYLTAQLKSGELRDRGNIFSPNNMRKNGYDQVYSYNDLNKQLKPKQEVLGRDAIFSPRPTATGTDFFTAISEANTASGGTGSPKAIQSLAEGIITAVLDLQYMSTDDAEKKIPQIRKDINNFNTIINNARKQYQNKVNTTKGEQQNAAKTTVDSINNMMDQFKDYTNVFNKFSSTLSQQNMTENQRNVQVAQNRVQSTVLDMRRNGNISGGMSMPQFGNMAKYATKNVKSLTREQQKRLKDLMPLFQKASQETGVPVDLLIAQSIQESALGSSTLLGVDYNGKTTDAVGLMQVRPAAAAEAGFRYDQIKNNDANNIMAGARYLAKKRDEFGNYEDAFRSYYMGSHGLRSYKAGKGYKKGYDQSTEYVSKIASNYAQFSKTGGRFQVVGEVDIPDNIRTDLNLLEQLQLLQENNVAVLNNKFGTKDPTKLSPAEKREYDQLSATVQGFQREMDTLRANTNNAIQSSQAKDTEERKRDREAKQYALDLVKSEIATSEQKLRVSKTVTDGDSYKETIESAKIFDRLQELKEQEAKMTSELTKFDATTYYAQNKVLGNYVSMSADLKLKTDVDAAKIDIEQRRKRWLKDAADQYAELIKKQNKEFIDNINNSIAETSNRVKDALQGLDYQKQINTWEIQDQAGISDMQAKRTLMDDPRYKDQYSDLQREELTYKINQTALEALNQADRNDMEVRRIIYNDAINEITTKIDEAQKKQAEMSAKLIENAKTINDQKVSEFTVTELKKQQTKLTEDLTKNSADLIEWKTKLRDLEFKLKATDGEFRPSALGIGETVRTIVNKNQRDMDSENYKYGEINNVLGSVQSSFNELISTAWEASDTFDDFFKILTGGSKESKEAFKAFGYGILETMLKVVQDRITQQFMQLITTALFGSTGTGGVAGGIGSGIAQVFGSASATRYGQAASAPQQSGGSGWLGTIVQMAGTALQTYLGGWFSGGSGGTMYTGNPEAADSMAIDMNMPRMSQGGRVKGTGAPNVDTIPTMLAPDEYVLPKNVTDTVGMGFLENLRADPSGVLNSKYNVSMKTSGEQKPPSNTNVYVVQPSNVPKSLTANDVVVTVADNISRNGELKQLIKSVVNN